MLPTEPNTPPNSTVWRIVHFPAVLLVIGFVFVMAGNVLASVLAHYFPPLHNNPVEMLQSAAVAAIVAGAYVRSSA